MSLKLDVGCGKNCQAGFLGLDIGSFKQKYKHDVREKWPFKDNTVDEVYSRYLIPCLTNMFGKFERVKFFNELHRVLKPTGTATILVPVYNSAGGHGHPHFHEAIYEGSLFFLNKEWRVANAPEVIEYTCDFDATWGYNMHPNITTRNSEYQQFAISNYCNAALDLMITLKKKGATL